MVAALLAAVAGSLGARVPLLSVFARQAVLFVLGLALVLADIAFKPPTPGAIADVDASASADDANTCVVQALTCLPRSSAPVVFRDAAAANAAAARNVKDNLSAADAQAAAEKQGASGKAAQLCAVVASDETSPLDKHLAATRLVQLQAGDGKATSACVKMANAFL
jgi:hypothetical protein